MRENQLFLRDLIVVASAVAVVTTIGLMLAPTTPVPKAPTTMTGMNLPSNLPPQAHRGASLFEKKGCASCHSVDGSARIGPSMLRSYGSQVTLDDGRVVAMDDAYIRESVLLPRAKSRPGYPPSMPAFDGMLDDRDIDAITVYVRSLQ